MRTQTRLFSIVLACFMSLGLIEGQAQEDIEIFFTGLQGDEFLDELRQYPDLYEIYIANGSRNDFDVSWVVTPISCNGDSDGEICPVPLVAGNFEYSWLGSLSGSSLCQTGLDPGTYGIRITNLDTSTDCFFFYELNEPPAIDLFAMNAIAPECGGECTGQASPVGIFGTGDLSYSYDSGESGPTATMLCNPFVLTITDDNGCTFDTTFVFTDEPDTLALTADITHVSCGGADDGSIDLTIVGGVGNPSVQWVFDGAPYSNDDDISGLEPGDYELTATDDNGCSAMATFTVEDAVPIDITAILTNIICNGDSTGQIALSVSGGDENFSYAWTGPNDFMSADADISNLFAGTYDLTVTDGLLCEEDTFFVLTERDPLIVTAVITELDCFGDSDAAIDVTVDGPFPIVDYAWTGDIVSGDQDISGLSAGSYTLTATDEQDCTVDSTFVIEEPEELILDLDTTHVLCNGESTGALDLIVMGGTGDPSFSWTPNGEITEDLTDIPAGSYTVTVTDENLCTAMITGEVQEPDSISITFVMTPTSCADGDDGEIDISVTGGTGDPTFLWTGPSIDASNETDEDLSDLSPGLYSVTVTDENACEKTLEVDLSDPDEITLDVTVVDVTCNGDSDGQITVVTGGGTGDITLTWPADFDPNNAPAGMVLLQATDENLCQKDTIITVGEPDAIEVALVITQPDCAGDETGAVDVTGSGGAGELSYFWIGPSIDASNEEDEDQTDMAEGQYTLTVTDENLCSLDTMITIETPDPIELTDITTDITCNGLADGTIDITATGGTGELDYLWLGPSIDGTNEDDEDQTGLSAGMYTVTVSDENGCSEDFMMEIEEPDAIEIDLVATDVTCNGFDDGTITFIFFGGTGDLSGDLIPDADPNAMPPGNYTYEVTDQNNCMADTMFTINEPDELEVTLVITQPDCAGDLTGDIDVTVSGGFGAPSFFWTGPSIDASNESDEDQSDLAEGVYTLTITDENDCTLDTMITIEAPDPLMVSEVLSNISCNGEGDGSIDIDVTGGTGDPTFLWTGPSIDASNEEIEDQTNLEAGMYTLTVSDENGCSEDFMYEITEPDAIIIDLVATDVTCNGFDDGTMTVSFSGGTGTGLVGTLNPDEDPNNLPPNTYTYTVMDDSGCEVDTTFVIDEPDALFIEFDVNDVSCFGFEDGAIDITVTGGTGVPSFLWTGPSITADNANDEDLSGLAAGTYTITVEDENGCMESTDIEVGSPTEITVTAVITDVACAGEETGAIDITAAGGEPILTYLWAGPSIDASNETNEDQVDLAAGMYTLTITDGALCQLDTLFEVLETDPILVDETLSNVNCFGDATGAIEIDPSGGQGMLTFLWTGPSIDSDNEDNEDQFDLLAGTYGLEVTDQLGCSAEFEYTLTQADSISIAATVTEPLCFNEASGAIDVTVTGDNPDFFHEWTSLLGLNESGIDLDLVDVPATTYELTVTDALGCTSTATYVMGQPDDLIATLDLTDPGCDLNDGMAESTVSGGTVAFDYTYTWSDGAGTIGTGPDQGGLTAGSYTFNVMDDNGCEVTIPFQLSDTVGTITAIVEPVQCFGDENGSIDITVSGLTGTLTYMWSGPSITGANEADEDLVNLAAGMYTISIEDSLGCDLVESYNVDSPDDILIPGMAIEESCTGENDGAIDISPTGGTGPFTFTWNGPGVVDVDTEDLTDLSPGTYTVTVTDSLMCSQSASFDVGTAIVYLLTGEVTDISCFAAGDGAIDITVDPELVDATYLWLGPDGTYDTEDLTELDEPGTYEVTITTADFCTLTESFELIEPELIEVELVITNSACGQDIGSVDFIVTGGTGEPTIQVFSIPDMMLMTPENMPGGTYEYFVSDENSCVANGTFTISDEFGTLDAEVSPVTCNGGADGAIDISIEGLTGDLDITWTGPGITPDNENDEDLSGLVAGDYTITIEDANGCTLGDTYTVTEAEPISITLVDLQSVDCNGDGNGFIDIDFDGVQGTPSFEWMLNGNFFANTEDISDLDGGEYTITITDTPMCSGSETFTITENDPIVVDAVITPIACNGESTGAITIDIDGGQGGYNTDWLGQNTGYESSFQNISNLAADIYDLTLTDALGCEFTASYEVTEAEAISIELIQQLNPSCDLANGLLEIDEPTGGNAPYDILWENSDGAQVSSTNIADNLPADTYTVFVTDEDGCEVSESYILSNEDAVLTADITDVSCFGFDDGAIDFTVTGNLTGDLTITWNGPGVLDLESEDLMDLIAGDYTVEVIDSLGCFFSEMFTVNQPDTIILNESITDVTCANDMDGAIDLEPTPIDDYDFEWTGGITADTEDISGVNGGTYTVVVTSPAGCEVSDTFILNEPDAINADPLVITPVTCSGDADGAIDITLNGGTGTYDSVEWTGPDFMASSQDINGLSGGNYLLEVMDSNGCTFSDNYDIPEPDPLTFDIIDQGPSSCDEPVGFIEVEAQGGNGGFMYIWTDEDDMEIGTAALLEDREAGIYTAEVTDNNGCQYEEDFEIVNAGVDLTADVTNVSCFGLSDGAIDLTVTGNVVLVDTLWTGPVGPFTTEDITNLVAGTYTVIVADEFGCEFTNSFEVTQPDSLFATATVTGVVCAGDETGAIEVQQVTGGDGNYTLTWIGPDGPIEPGGPIITDLTDGVYTLTVTDGVPCSREFDFEVTAPDPITIDANPLDPTCIGLEDGSIAINIGGGFGDLTVNWTGDINTMDEDLADLASGTYILEVTDDSLCTAGETFMLQAPQAINLDLVVDSIDCAGDDDAEVFADAFGNGELTYAWTQGGAPFSDQPLITDLEPNQYDLTITDNIGCQLDTFVVITEPEGIDIDLQDLDDVTCFGDADGEIDVNVSGGLLNYTFNWTGPDGPYNTEDITGLSGGEYILTVSDANDCEASESYTVNEPDLLTISLGSAINAQCENTANGSIDILVSGGTPDFDYDWDGPGSFSSMDEDLTGLLPGTYSVDVTDEEGCEAGDSFTISYDIEISADAGDYPPICNGELMILNGTALPSSSDVGWNVPGGPTFSNESSTDIFTSTANTVFIFTVTNGDCIAVDTTFLDVLPLPEPDAGEDREVFLEEEVVLGGDPTLEDGVTFSWQPAEGLDDPLSPNPTWIADGAQIFEVTVLATNGCSGQDQVIITINPTLEIPEGVSPNDDGANDTWELGNRALFPEMTAKVFNRWGDKLWESAPGYPVSWDGRFENKDLPVGTYYYIIELHDERFPDPITGPITIFR